MGIKDIKSNLNTINIPRLYLIRIKKGDKMNKETIINLLPNLKVIEKQTCGIGTIFALHRVAKIEENEILYNQFLKVSEEYLEDTILKLKKKNYKFISLDELEVTIKSGSKEKFAIFTFDDGYKDNYTTAYPIFKKYNIPFTIYITNDFLNKKAVLWWYIIEDIIKNNEIVVTSKMEKFSCRTKKEKENTFVILRNNIFTFGGKDLAKKIKNYLPNYKFSFSEKCDELCMDWEELKVLANDPLVTIGAHTVSHPAMNTLTLEEMEKEVLDGKKELEEKLKISIDHFAYPYGTTRQVNEREFNFLKNNDFKTSTTTRANNIRELNIDSSEQLPRILLKENFSLERNMFLIPFLRRYIKV